MSFPSRERSSLFPEEEPLDFQDQSDDPSHRRPSVPSNSGNRHQRVRPVQETSLDGMYSGQQYLSVQHSHWGLSTDEDTPLHTAGAYCSELSYQEPPIAISATQDSHRVQHGIEYFGSNLGAYRTGLADMENTDMFPAACGAEALPSEGAASSSFSEVSPSDPVYQSSQIMHSTWENVPSSFEGESSGSSQHSKEKGKTKLYMLNPLEHPEMKERILNAKRAMRNRGKKHGDEMKLSKQLKELEDQVSTLKLEKARRKQRNSQMENLLSQLALDEQSQYASHVMEFFPNTGGDTDTDNEGDNDGQ